MIDMKNYPKEWVLLSQIDGNDKRFQFRQNLEVKSLEESLREHGQKFPVLLRRLSSGRLQIVSGFRRYTTAKALNWERVLGIILPESELNDEEALKTNFIENIARKSLTNMDIVYSCKKLSSDGRSNREIAKLLGKSESIVRRYLKVANAPAEVQEAVKHGKITVKNLDKIITERKTPEGAQETAPDLEDLKTALKSPDSFEKMQDILGKIHGSMAKVPEIPDISKLSDKIQKSLKTAEFKPQTPNREPQKIQIPSFMQKDTSKEPAMVANERMYVKPVHDGFDLVLKFRAKRDNIDKTIEFMEKNLKKLKDLKSQVKKQVQKQMQDQIQNQAKKQQEQKLVGTQQPLQPQKQPTQTTLDTKISDLLIEGPSSVKVGETITLKISAYTEDAVRIKAISALNPAWSIDDPALAALSRRSGSSVKLTGKAKGVCWVKAAQGNVKNEVEIEVK